MPLSALPGAFLTIQSGAYTAVKNAHNSQPPASGRNSGDSCRMLSHLSPLEVVRDVWLEHCRRRSTHTALQPIKPETVRTYDHALRPLGWLGEVPVGDLRPAQVLLRVDELMAADPGSAGSKVAKFAHTLRALLAWARQRDLCIHNAASQLRIEYRPTPRFPLTLRQAQAIWSEINACEIDRPRKRSLVSDHLYRVAWEGVADALRLLILTGARRAEICEATATYLQLDERQLLVPYAKGRPRVIPLGPFACSILRRRLELTANLSPFLFPSLTLPGRPLDGTRVLELFHCICRRLDLFGPSPTTPGRKRFCVHTLRNSLATWARERGDSLDSIAGLLGHRDRKTTERIYTIYAVDPSVRGIADAFDAVLQTVYRGEEDA